MRRERTLHGGSHDVRGRGLPPRPHPYVLASPDELCTNLPDARVTSTGDVPEARAVDIPARIRELRLVENVEDFAPNLERFGFGDRDRLLQPEI